MNEISCPECKTLPGNEHSGWCPFRRWDPDRNADALALESVAVAARLKNRNQTIVQCFKLILKLKHEYGDLLDGYASLAKTSRPVSLLEIEAAKFLEKLVDEGVCPKVEEEVTLTCGRGHDGPCGSHCHPAREECAYCEEPVTQKGGVICASCVQDWKDGNG